MQIDIMSQEMDNICTGYFQEGKDAYKRFCFQMLMYAVFLCGILVNLFLSYFTGNPLNFVFLFCLYYFGLTSVFYFSSDYSDSSSELFGLGSYLGAVVISLFSIFKFLFACVFVLIG